MNSPSNSYRSLVSRFPISNIAKLDNSILIRLDLSGALGNDRHNIINAFMMRVTRVPEFQGCTIKAQDELGQRIYFIGSGWRDPRCAESAF